jgi:murein DD-endopeptidase MepM/ murein hydrolase activator NlpD
MARRRAITAVLALACLSVWAGAASGGTAGTPASASARAYALQDQTGARTDYVSIDGDGDISGDGTRVRVATDGARGRALATALSEKVDVFEGLVTAESVRVSAEATSDGTSTSGSVTGLTIAGTPVDAPAGRTRYDLGGYGTLVALGSGATGILGLRAKLTKPYKTHKAGEVIRVAYASADASDAVRAVPQPAPATPAAKGGKKKRPRLTAKQRLERAATRRERRQAAALLAAPGYAFPVAGTHSFSDDYGAPRPDTGTHIGNDVFADFGMPVVAVADGTLYRVGTRKVPGNRLWLRDRKGHRFFYAHLSDFAAAAYNGAEVHAGEVIGFVGNTGDAEPTPPHVHFEVHLANHTPVNPYRYLLKWESTGVGTDKWLARYGKDPGVRPGALVVVKDFLAG